MQRAEAKGDTVPQRYEDLVQPHIDSFDYFLGPGMEHVVEELEGITVRARGVHIELQSQPALSSCQEPVHSSSSGN